jgi:hypothetical protein
MSILEGMACGLKPIINDWIGADEIYGSEYIYKNIQDIERILNDVFEPDKYRQFVIDNYDFDKTYPLIEGVITQVDNDFFRNACKIRDFAG